MTSHSEHEKILRDLLAGEVSRADALAVLGDCEQCAALLSAVESLGGVLDQAARDERATLAEAEHSALPGGDQRVREFFRERRGGPRFTPALMLVAGALAATFLALLLWRPWEGPGADPDAVFLGERGEIELIAPRGALDENTWSSFSWRSELPTGWWYEIQVFAQGAPADAPPIATEDHLKEPHWTPPAVDNWPRAIRWNVRVKYSGGDFAPVWESASLR